MNSRRKGARGERLWRDELTAKGYESRRGQQFSGSPDSPDVVCPALPWAHFEVKCVERLSIEDAMDQARRDAGRKIPLLAHKRNHRRWLVTMDADIFFELVREFRPNTDTNEHKALRGQASPFPPSSAAKDVGLTPKESGGPEDDLGRGASAANDSKTHQTRTKTKAINT